ncbi:ROK family protein [Phycicoccus endophyticus]|uniref:ROK family protein n=1 Tax=Phycicoccus endophyticus TaxID=1690220 RepID=UPI0019B6A5EF|nr:ROK family protein [Phycicoccus endophyticus]GGL45054.1 sugar kinase [Phycicoccus endophyticus]
MFDVHESTAEHPSPQDAVTPSVPVTAGVDIGGTRVKVVLRQGAGVVGRHVEPTPADVGARVGEVVAQAVERLVAADPSLPRPQRVGVVVPGLVDEVAGVGVWAANLGWADLDLRATVARAVGTDVVIGHDVRAGLLGEHLLGAARGVDDVLFVPLGTGVAIALMSGGRVVHGTTWSGELGHVRVDPDGLECGCGRRGCLETVVGARAVARRWQAAGREGDARAVAEAVGGADPLASQIWHAAVDTLAGALAAVVAAAGGRRVVVGGGMAEAGPVLLDPLRAALTARVPDPALEVVRAELGEWAGAIGAAHLVPVGS